MPKEVEKYLILSPKNQSKRNYTLKVGGLELYFNTIKEADKYYQEYIK